MAVLGAVVVQAGHGATAPPLVSEPGDAFRGLLDRTPVPVVVIGGDARIVYQNAAAVAFKGASMIGTEAADHVHPDDWPPAAERLAQLLAGGEREQALILRAATGRGFVWSEVTGVAVTWEGQPAVQAVIVDLHGRGPADATGTGDASASLYRTVVSSLSEGLVVLASDGRPLTWNQAALALLQISEDQLRGLDPDLTLSLLGDDGTPLPIQDIPSAAAVLADRPDLTDTVVGYRRPGGPQRWLSCTTRALPDGSVVASFQDVTAEKDAAARLSHLARYDQLTGLPNRALGLERLASAVARIRRGSPQLAVLFIDLDDFKRVNDTLGHAAGDELLVTVADRLRRAVRPGDTVSRFGGDEFVLIAESINGVLGAEALADRVCAATRPPVQLGHHSVSVTASIGIALAAPGDTPDTLLAQADAALYRAKSSGRSCHALFDASMRARALRRLELEDDLRRAIDLRALHVVYQPYVAIATRRVAGFEALVRWDHPELGALEPAEFVALAEDTGMITALGAVVLEEALDAVTAWHEQGVDVPVGVNVSGRQMDDPRLVDSVVSAVTSRGIDPAWLLLEITESALTEPTPRAVEALDRLRQAGIRLALDDFGTGSSSLAALRSLPVDTVKLDRRFLAGIDTDPAARAVVAAVVQLVRALGLTAVAEGVESASQLEVLAELGCALAQGYHLSPAVGLDGVAQVAGGDR